MADTGRVSPSQFVGSPDKCDDSDNLYGDDGSYGFCDKAKYDYWGGYDFDGAGLPDGAIIDGIVVEAKDCYRENSGKDGNFTVRLSWNARGNWTAEQKTIDITDISSPGGTYALGGSVDTWGRTWSSSEFKNNNFWVEFLNDEKTGDEGKVYVDWMPVTVYYHVAAPKVTQYLPGNDCPEFPHEINLLSGKLPCPPPY